MSMNVDKEDGLLEKPKCTSKKINILKKGGGDK